MGWLAFKKNKAVTIQYISSEIVTDAENKPMVTSGEGRTKWEIGIDIHTTIYKTDDK